MEPLPATVASEHARGLQAAGRGYELRFAADTLSTVQILHVTAGGEDQLPLRIVAEKDATVSIAEIFIGAGWTNRLSRFELADSARLMRSVRLLRDEGFASLRDEARLATGASFVTTFLPGGGGDTRRDGAL